jgi:hypothetical protein
MNYFFLDQIEYFNKLTKMGNYLAFEFNFPTSWEIDGGLISQHKHEFKKKKKLHTLSIWSEFKDSEIRLLEETVSKIIQINKEHEEKERLFKEKVKELRSLFLESDLDSLRNIKFDTHELIREQDETSI